MKIPASVRMLAHKVSPSPPQPDGCTMAPEFIFHECCNLHDRLYLSRRGTRKQADDLFLFCMLRTAERSTRPWLWEPMAYVYYVAVRVFGRFYWTNAPDD